jgi:uridine phosphorylase
MPVAVCSHGIGAAGAAIAFEELIAAGARWLVRAGSCGGLQPGMKAGDLVIATAAVQNTGYGQETVPAGYPAVADMTLTLALKHAAVEKGQTFHEGIVLSRDNFYRGVNLPTNPDYQLMSRANVQAVEMECAALFIVGSLRGVGTAAILAVDGNVVESGGEEMATYAPGADAVQIAIESEIALALQALRNTVP